MSQPLFHQEEEQVRHLISQIPLQMAVYDITGERIGAICEADPETGTLAMKRGRFFAKTILIPPDRIAAVDEQGVHLRCSLGELLSPGLTPRSGSDLDVPVVTPFTNGPGSPNAGANPPTAHEPPTADDTTDSATL